MGSDRARVTYDESRHYRSVVMQQGRVTVEADWNEEAQLIHEELRKDVLDIVGPCCTPNDGYRVIQTGKPSEPSFDVVVSEGTMYVGGMRVALAKPLRYSHQTEWFDRPPDPIREIHSKTELILLYLREQEVSAVEDTALREVALGGPDTAQRSRLIQHIVRMDIEGRTCATAQMEAQRRWATQGLHFDEKTARLKSSATLEVGFQPAKTNPDPCEPQALGGYLGADNQLIRVQIVGFDAQKKKYSLVWGFDNASFLYRVTIGQDNRTLKLLSRPVDDFHKPRVGQAVEVLRSTVELSAITNDYIASATGSVFKLDVPYVSDTQSVTLPPPPQPSLPSEYSDTKQTPVVFLRVWEEQHDFVAGETITLGTTGLQVTLQTANNEPFRIGDYWLMAVRPDTGVDPNASTQIFPHRYLEGPQPPDGPREWICALAVIEWDGNKVLRVLDNCRCHCDNLCTLTKRNLGGCCTVTVKPEDITESNTLQAILDKYSHQERVTICLMPGVYNLPASLLLGPEHSNLTLEGCHDGVVIQAAEGQETNFLQGLIVLNRANNVTIKGIRFELPQVPFAQANGRIAHMEPAVTRRILGTQLRDLHISIGLRPLHCALLTVKDCLFRFSLTPEVDVYGIGIFASSECWGLNVQGNRFVREEDFLRMQESPLRVLIGFLLAPATIFKSGRSGPSSSVAVPAGTLVRSLLQDASFVDNYFSGLSGAIYISADIGVIKIERNTVRDCYTALWLQSLRSIAFTSSLTDNSVNRAHLAAAHQLYTFFSSIVLDPITQIGSVLARGFPLPKEFDTSDAAHVEEQRVSKTAEAEQLQSQTLFNRVLAALHSTPEAAAPGKEAMVKLKESNLPATDTTFTSGTGLGRFNALHEHLASFERAALLQVAGKQGLRLALHLSDNNIDATVTHMTSGIAILVWDDERDVVGTMTMSANKVQNQGQPTVGVAMIESCAITGNIIMNQPLKTETQGPRSLYVVAGQAAGIAVTGNVFGGRPQLPPRPPFNPPVPPPMDSWEFFNTVLYN